MDFCADRRSKPKIPKHVVLIEEWPKTSNGKIMKQPLRERLMHEASLLAVRRLKERRCGTLQGAIARDGENNIRINAAFCLPFFYC
jgi:hypothetical protein